MRWLPLERKKVLEIVKWKCKGDVPYLRNLKPIEVLDLEKVLTNVDYLLIL